MQIAIANTPIARPKTLPEKPEFSNPTFPTPLARIRSFAPTLYTLARSLTPDWATTLSPIIV